RARAWLAVHVGPVHDGRKYSWRERKIRLVSWTGLNCKLLSPTGLGNGFLHPGLGATAQLAQEWRFLGVEGHGLPLSARRLRGSAAQVAADRNKTRACLYGWDQRPHFLPPVESASHTAVGGQRTGPRV